MADLSRISQNKFLIIGRAGMDLYPDPPGTRTEDATRFFSCLGGSSANIAVALAKHGGQAALVTSVSDDAIGRFCLNELDKYGIDCRHVKSVKGAFRNSLAIVESRVEDHQSVIYRNGAADFQMQEADVLGLPYSDYGALITTGTVFAATPSRNAAFKAFERARQADLPLVFDLDYRPYSWASAREASDIYTKAAALCDIIIGNDVEFGVMAGDYNKGLDKARELARENNRIIIYKMGEEGSITFHANTEIKTGIYPVTALKPTGAGDGFMGGFIASLASGYSLMDSVLRGAACASIVVSKVGCAPAMPTTYDLEQFIESQDRSPQVTQDRSPQVTQVNPGECHASSTI